MLAESISEGNVPVGCAAAPHLGHAELLQGLGQLHPVAVEFHPVVFHRGIDPEGVRTHASPGPVQGAAFHQKAVRAFHLETDIAFFQVHAAQLQTVEGQALVRVRAQLQRIGN